MSARLTRRAACLGAAATLSGCAALSSIRSATERLEVYELTPARVSGDRARAPSVLTILRPDATAALDTERILVKPNPLAVEYLPGSRWAEPAPVLVQSLLARSIAQTGAVAFVGRNAEGPVPDYALLMRLDAFQAEAFGVPAEGALRVVVRFEVTVLDDEEQSVVASRSFAAAAPPTGETVIEVVAVFDRLVEDLLGDAVPWVLRTLADETA